MGTIKFSKLAKIEIDHLFFENGYCKQAVIPQNDLIFMPLNGLDMEQAGIRTITRRPNSLTIYGEVEKMLPTNESYTLNKLKNHKIDSFIFAVFDQNPFYLPWSNLPISRPLDSCLYFTPKHTDLNNQNISLTVNDTINWEQDNIRCHPGNFTYLYNGQLNSADIALESVFKTVRINPTRLLPQSDNGTLIEFDSTVIKPGQYNLLIKNQVFDTIFLLGTWKGSLPLAIIEFPLQDNIQPTFKLWNDNLTPKMPLPIFKAVFEKRSAVWKYLVYFRTKPEMADVTGFNVSDVKITSNDTIEQFVTRTLSNPLDFELISQTPFDFMEIQKQRLKLNYSVNGDAKFKNNLPIPPTEHLSFDDNQWQSYISITI